MKARKLFVFMASSMLFGACAKEDDPTLLVSETTITITKNGEYGSIDVTSNTAWKATVDATWCTLFPYVEIGIIAVIADTNRISTERRATVTIQAGALQEKVTVIQEAGDVILSIAPTFMYPEANAGTYSINVMSNDAAWTTEVEYIIAPGGMFPDRTWCVLNPSSGVGNGVISINLPKNSNSRRAAIVKITAGDVVQTDTIIQHGVPPMDEGVTINGITWATRNVGGFGAFADFFSSPGMYYQFNSYVGCSYTDGVVEPVLSSYIGADGNDWSRIYDPCPEGWRVPTYEETQTLKNAGYRYVSADKGSWFGPDAQTATITTPGSAVFLPLCGTLFGDNRYYESEGRYWVNHVIDLTYVAVFSFEASWGDPTRRHGLPIRCVKE
ncbi:hypothetical protein SAMD00024442_7_69 [Candidatus Symbiothrix dinenymphae]|nr:hypothetical protein SAMD00024442_7_69 [Candidatus Symbiothrix dinenymphae]